MEGEAVKLAEHVGRHALQIGKPKQSQNQSNTEDISRTFASST
jgi:hypothetical protein